MKSVTNLALLALLLMTPACEMLGDIAKAVNFNTLLASITDAKTAEQAKPVLDVAVAKLVGEDQVGLGPDGPLFVASYGNSRLRKFS